MIAAHQEDKDQAAVVAVRANTPDTPDNYEAFLEELTGALILNDLTMFKLLGDVIDQLKSLVHRSANNWTKHAGVVGLR